MEAIIKTNNKNLFQSVIQILKSLNFQVETKGEKENSSPTTSSSKRMAQILEKLSAHGGVKSIPDPMEWQRETRKDRKII